MVEYAHIGVDMRLYLEKVAANLRGHFLAGLPLPAPPGAQSVRCG